MENIQATAKPYILLGSGFSSILAQRKTSMEDIANWIVSNGKGFYFSILESPKNTPISVNDHIHQILYGIADEVCMEKYGESPGVY